MIEQVIINLKARFLELLPTGTGSVNAARIRQALAETIDEVAAADAALKNTIEGKSFRFTPYVPGKWKVGEFAITTDKKKIFTPKSEIANSQVEPSVENIYWRLVFEDTAPEAGGNVNTVNNQLPDAQKNVLIMASHIDTSVNDSAWWGTPSLKIKGALDFLANKIKLNATSLNTVSFHIAFTQLNTRARIRLSRKITFQPINTINVNPASGGRTLQVLATGFTGQIRTQIADVNTDIAALTAAQATEGYTVQILVKLTAGESFADALLSGTYYD